MIEAINIANGQITPSLYTKLEQIFSKNNQLINREELQPTVQKVLQDKHIFLNMQATELQDAIKELVLPLIGGGTDLAYSVKSTSDSSTIYDDYKILDKHIVLVHVKPTDGVKKLGLSVGTNLNGLLINQKENDPIQLLFCLASIDNYSHLNLMKNIIELIQDKKKIHQLIGQDSIENFKQILFSKSDKKENV